MPNLDLIAIDRYRTSPGGVRHMGGKTDLLVEIFIIAPIDFQADDFSRDALQMLVVKLRTTDEKIFLEIHRPTETYLKRRISLRIDQRLFRPDIIDFEQNKAGFEARHIEREHSRRL